MDKKIPAIIVLAALGSEVVFNEHHEPAVNQPHVATDIKPPIETVSETKASGPAGANSATLTITPNKEAPIPPHIEGGGI
jgi:hypothetical protein